jgi:hypothetical protein
MCAAVPVALLLLVILAALTILRLSKAAPNALLLSRLLDSLGTDPDPADCRAMAPPTPTSGSFRHGKTGTA